MRALPVDSYIKGKNNPRKFFDACRGTWLNDRDDWSTWEKPRQVQNIGRDAYSPWLAAAAALHVHRRDRHARLAPLVARIKVEICGIQRELRETKMNRHARRRLTKRSGDLAWLLTLFPEEPVAFNALEDIHDLYGDWGQPVHPWAVVAGWRGRRRLPK